MDEITSEGPIWRALGYSRPIHDPRKPWLWIWSRYGGVLCFRASQLVSFNSLTQICPDIGFWRESYPLRKDRGAVDCEKVREVMVRLCFEAGLYEPPEELKPRGRGRPRKSQLTVLL